MITDFMSVTIMATGFAVAFFHAVLPTHWLPFVIASRGQGWSQAKTLAIAFSAGLAHALFTAVLGVVLVFAGMKAEGWNEHIFHLAAGMILFCFGGYYLYRQAKGRHGHCCGSHDDDKIKPAAFRSDKAVIASLLAMLALSPCEGFLPVYLSGIHYGWSGFALLTATLVLATCLGMGFFTWLGLLGWERLRLKVLEKYESLILGSLLCLLGIFVILIEH